METLLSMRCLMIRDTSTNLHTGNLAEHAPFGGKEHGKLYKGSAAEHAMRLEKKHGKLTREALLSTRWDCQWTQQTVRRKRC
jgi:hypothetical protein